MLLKKSKKSKKHPFIWLTIFVLLILIVSGIFYFIFNSEVLKVKKIDYEYSNNYLNSSSSSGFFTNNYLISSLTTQIVKNQKILGYLGSDNILFWFFGKNNELINRNMLPSVKSVKIETNVVDRQLDIKVREKELSGVICNPKNKCFAFDDEGIIFAPAPDVKGSLILKINDSNNRPLTAGEKFLPREHWINNMIKVIEVLKNNDLNIERIEIRDMELEEWEATISSGLKFIFNFNFVPEDFNEVIRTLKEKSDFSQMDYFDMRVENRIYYK